MAGGGRRPNFRKISDFSKFGGSGKRAIFFCPEEPSSLSKRNSTGDWVLNLSSKPKSCQGITSGSKIRRPEPNLAKSAKIDRFRPCSRGRSAVNIKARRFKFRHNRDISFLFRNYITGRPARSEAKRGRGPFRQKIYF